MDLIWKIQYLNFTPFQKLTTRYHPGSLTGRRRCYQWWSYLPASSTSPAIHIQSSRNCPLHFSVCLLWSSTPFLHPYFWSSGLWSLYWCLENSQAFFSIWCHHILFPMQHPICLPKLAHYLCISHWSFQHSSTLGMSPVKITRIGNTILSISVSTLPYYKVVGAQLPSDFCFFTMLFWFTGTKSTVSFGPVPSFITCVKQWSERVRNDR